MFVALPGRLRIGLLQIREHQFGMQTRIGKHHGLQIAFEKFLRNAAGFVDVAAANPQRAIHHRRIVKHKSFLRGGRAVGIQNLHIRLQKLAGQLARIGDRRRAANKLRIAAIKIRDAPQSPQHVAKMAAEHAAIGVQFIQHDVSQILEQPRPARVVRQNSGVQHVRIGQYDVAFFADGFARVAGRVAVVGKDAESVVEPLIQIVNFRQLILGQGLGGKKINRASVGIFQNRVYDRQVVAQRFSRSRGRDDDNIFSVVRRLRGRRLMGVKPLDALGLVGRP